jgi:hypothetical protein
MSDARSPAVLTWQEAVDRSGQPPVDHTVDPVQRAARVQLGVTGNKIPRDIPDREKDLLRIARASWVMELRSQGMQWRAIGAHIGIDARTLMRDHEWLLGMTVSSQELLWRRWEMGQQIAELRAAYWDRARTGDLDAAAFVVRTMEREARLFGLDAPKVVEVIQPDQAVSEFIGLIEAMVSHDES